MKISENIFLRSIKESQRQDFLDQWNADRCKRERIYISYDSTNKNCQAGDIDIVEFGAAKVDAGLPIFNYAVGERARLEEKIHEMQRFMEQHEDKEYEFGPAFHKYFHMHYNKENGYFVYGEPRLPAFQNELELCGYFAIISSEKNGCKGCDKPLQYIALKEKELAKKPNYLTVPAAIRELEKIEPTRQLDKVYRLDHAVTKTQKVILSAFGMDWNHVKYRVENISKILKI